MNKYFSNQNTIVLTLNEYPYFTLPNIFHYLLWIHPKIEKKHSNKEINEIICNKILNASFQIT